MNDDGSLEDLKQAIRELRSGFPDFTVSVDDVVAQGDRVAYRWTMTGTHQNEYEGLAATGKTLTATGMTFLRLQDNLDPRQAVAQEPASCGAGSTNNGSLQTRSEPTAATGWRRARPSHIRGPRTFGSSERAEASSPRRTCATRRRRSRLKPGAGNAQAITDPMARSRAPNEPTAKKNQP